MGPWIQIITTLLPLILSLFDKGAAACKLWGNALSKLASVTEARYPVFSATVAIPALTLKCCGDSESLCKEMASSIRTNQAGFVAMAAAEVAKAQGATAA